MNDTPVELSVVIGAHRAGPPLAAALAALERQDGAPSLEVIVADSSPDDEASRAAAGRACVEVLRAPHGTTLPELRSLGIARARGRVIAILDPYSIAAPDWARCVVDVHAERPELVVGGSVEPHRPESLDLAGWALYFNEYGLFLPPCERGPVALVPGSNVSYKREALYDGANPRHPVFWKTFVNWDIESRDGPPFLDPRIRVALWKPIPFGEFLRSRFDHGRCFAAMRVAGTSRGARLLRAAAAPLVAPLLFARWTRGIWPKGRFRGRYLATVPFQAALFAVWAAGEACGYAFGAGRSCGRLHY